MLLKNSLLNNSFKMNVKNTRGVEKPSGNCSTIPGTHTIFYIVYHNTILHNLFLCRNRIG